MSRIVKSLEGMPPITRTRFAGDNEKFEPITASLYTSRTYSGSATVSILLSGPVLTKTGKRHKTRTASRRFSPITDTYPGADFTVISLFAESDINDMKAEVLKEKNEAMDFAYAIIDALDSAARKQEEEQA